MPDLRYITKVQDRGWAVRLPKRVGGQAAFFNAGKSSMKAALDEATAWRDSFFKDDVLHKRHVEGAGISVVQDGAYTFYKAVWQYEKRQMYRLFSVNKYGAELAEQLANIARAFGIIAEQERLEEWYEGV